MNDKDKALWVQPTDIVEVVRCKNCKNYDATGCADGFGWCEAWDGGRCDNHYCNFGERRSNAD